MKYDIDDIADRVLKRRKKFFCNLIVSTIFILFCIFMIIYYDGITSDFLFFVAIILVVAYFTSYLKKEQPKYIFSKEIRGINVKEDEYVVLGTTKAYKWAGIRYQYSRSRHRGDIYIRTEDDKVHFITGLPKDHVDIYEIGDRLIRYEGTRYPVVESRELQRQPCPLCGSINASDMDCCSSCGLKIISRRVS